VREMASALSSVRGAGRLGTSVVIWLLSGLSGPG